MKPLTTHRSGQSQLSTQNILKIHVTHFRNPVAFGFVIFLQESWMNKTCTGSQEVQQLWQTEAILQHKKNHRALLSSFSRISLTFSSSLIFLSNKNACDFGPSSEPRMMSSSFFGVLIVGQSFRRDAKIVDHRFSVMSPKKQISHFVGLNLGPSVFSASTIFSRSFKTVL